MQDSTEVIMEQTMEYAAIDSADFQMMAERMAASGAGDSPLDQYLAMLGPMLYGLIAFFAIILVLSIVTNWIIFEKAGRKGWESLIPIYNIIVLFKIIGLALSNLLWILLPFAGPIVLAVKVISRFAKVFGRGTGFAFGLFFFPYIFQCILAFDKSIVYVGPNASEAAEPEDGRLDN